MQFICVYVYVCMFFKYFIIPFAMIFVVLAFVITFQTKLLLFKCKYLNKTKKPKQNKQKENR